MSSISHGPPPPRTRVNAGPLCGSPTTSVENGCRPGGHAEPLHVRLVIDKATGKPKGYGFCEYMDEDTALSARQNLQGYEINGRQLSVEFAENGRNADRNREKVEDPQFFTIEETHYSTSKSYVMMKACIALVF